MLASTAAAASSTAGIERERGRARWSSSSSEAIDRRRARAPRSTRWTRPTRRRSCSTRLEELERRRGLAARRAAGGAPAWTTPGWTAWPSSPGPATDAALRWVAATLTARALAGELQESTERMSDLVGGGQDLRLHGPRRAASRSTCTRGSRPRSRCSATSSSTPRSRSCATTTRALPKLTVRGSELNQVWTNLLDNAIDALGERGTITIRTRREARGVRVDVVRRRAGHPGGHPRPHLRLLLHHQGRRARHRAGAGERAPDRRRPPRRLADGRTGAGRDDVHAYGCP